MFGEKKLQCIGRKDVVKANAQKAADNSSVPRSGTNALFDLSPNISVLWNQFFCKMGVITVFNF